MSVTKPGRSTATLALMEQSSIVRKSVPGKGIDTMHRRITWWMPRLLVLFAGVATASLNAQGKAALAPMQDSDRDGLSDAMEAVLLARFFPVFMVSRTDCSGVPAQFVPEKSTPIVVADDGTIYGQAFPRRDHPGEVELHYYHLWRKDCGEMGHALDAEHVSALVRVGEDAGSATAMYWYAAAHEDTICDAGHLSRALTIAAEDRGATVWISSGKHASFLSETLCSHGCGGDHCEAMQPLKTRAVVNLGESSAAMNEIAWLHFPQWPLEEKMLRSDFSEERLRRVDGLPQTDVVWANPSKRPAQAAILGANAGIGGAAAGTRATDTALVISSDRTGSALGKASGRTGDALGKSSRDVWGALKKSVEKTGDFLHPEKKD